MTDAAKPSWTETVVGQRILADSAETLGSLVRRCHGDTLVWAGAQPQAALTVQRCMVRNRFFVGVGAQSRLPAEADASPLEAQLSQLPLPNNSVDAFVLHYGLERLQDPRAALREIARVLQPGGRLVLAALNPWSLLGVRGLVARAVPDPFSPVRFPNPLRLLDWLALLDFELEGPVRYESYGLPYRRAGSAEVGPGEPQGDEEGSRLSALVEKLPLADTYLLSAVKQAYGVPPLRLPLRGGVGKLAGVGYPRMTARLVHVDFRENDR